MSSTPQLSIFGLRSLNGRVQLFAEDVTRTRVFTNKFRMGRQMLARDETAEWDEQTLTRGLAPVVGHDSPFPNRALIGKVNRRTATAHVKLSKVIPARKLYNERFPGTMAPNAAQVVDDELLELTKEVANTVEYLCAHTMQGTLTVSTANIPGTEVPFTIAYTPNTYTASASWATAGTGILSSEIPALKTDFEQTCGLAPAQVIAGNTVETYIVGNTEVTNFAQRALGERFITTAGTLNGPMLGGLQVGGLTWQLTEGGYVPSGGSFTRYLATTDRAIVLPADNELSNVLGMIEGRGFVPAADLAPAESAETLVRPAPQAGFYSYATRVDNGPAVRLYVGWVGLPTLLRPDAVDVLDLVP